jgi:hypothetical protein
MQVQTLPNRVQNFNSYVYENVTWSQDAKSPEVQVRSLERSSLMFTECRRKGNVYDHLPRTRWFEFVPLWNGEIDNKKAYGFERFDVAEDVLPHTLVKISIPQVTHRFW